MSVEHPSRDLRPITATHLYDFAVCAHRVALDFTLDRSRRAPPDEAQRLLLERGRAVEARIAASLGYAAVAGRPDDPGAALAETLELMRKGVAGISQGVLASGRHLAIPDLLRRTEGPSDLGEFHYVAGDIKSGMQARTDQALQVVFAARLLERIQGRRPSTGFLLLGDGREESFEIADVLDSAEAALDAVEAVADGRRGTFPFLSDACARCRWRSVCLPELQRGPDLSFVAGMTPTRKRLLLREGIRTAGEVAALDAPALARLAGRGVAIDGMSALQKQALALTTGRPIRTGRRRRLDPPGRAPREHVLVAGWDPLAGGEPFLFGWGSRPGPGAALDRSEVRLAEGEPGRSAILFELLAWLGDGASAVLHYGSGAPRAFDRIADEAGLDPAVQGQIEARFVDLAPRARGGTYLPVRRYSFEEVAAAVGRRALPPLDEPEDAPFVWFENHRLGPDGEWRARLEARAVRDLESLAALRDWIASDAPSEASRA